MRFLFCVCDLEIFLLVFVDSFGIFLILELFLLFVIFKFYVLSIFVKYIIIFKYIGDIEEVEK